MPYNHPLYREPDWSQEFLVSAPDCKLIPAPREGIAPVDYHALSIFPEYFKLNGKWVLAEQSRMDTVCVAYPEPGKERVEIVEFRNLRKGDLVVVGRTEDASEGIYVYTQGFSSSEESSDTFAFRSGRSRETAFSMDYDQLYEILKAEHAQGGYVTWILGSAITLDQESRKAIESLIRQGFVQAIFCGTALAAFDLEQGMFGSTWGQATFEQEGNRNRNFYRAINAARKAGSLEALVASGQVRDGIIKACVECGVSLVLAGTIRDRFALPGTYDNVYEAQNAMRTHTRKTSTIIMVSAVLFTIASGNMTPSYNVFDGTIRPVYLYTIDIQEFTVNKLSDRGTLTATSIVTNGQDFVTQVAAALTSEERPL